MIIIIMGVCGCGKTTVGEMLAAQLGCGFSDADGFHPKENVEKMRAGIPLTDEDRWPWLGAIRKAADDWQAKNESHVIACSALRQAYRDVLSPKGDVIFVYMKGSREVIQPRLEARTGHYMNPNLLESQFAILDEPTDALTVDVGGTPQDITADVLRQLPDFVIPGERPKLQATLNAARSAPAL